MSDENGYGEQNRRSWNHATRAHNSHKQDQAEFFRQGGGTLFDEELALLGDLDGLRLLHLQCNSGQDSLSLAARGARVTGVDISDDAIDFARRLSRDSGVEVEFERDDVYDWLAREGRPDGRRFDVVFSSYGAIPWLRDIAAWARGAASVLKPSGKVVLVEFHPAAMMFDEDWTLRYPYSNGGEAVREPEGVGDYVLQSGSSLAPSGFERGRGDFRNPEASYEFYWSPFDVAGALGQAGLVLAKLTEYPYSTGARMWNRMRELPGKRFAPPEDVPRMPLMYGIVAGRGSEAE